MSSSTWTYVREPEPIAKGGQAEVYRATRSDGLVVAVKMAKGGSSTMALEQEIRMLESLERAHVQGVIRCLDVAEMDGHLSMIMPFYPEHLGEWVQRVTSSPEPETLDDILHKTATIARTLAHMHGVTYANAHIVHRDIKPENIFLDENGRLALADFGGAMTITGLRAVELSLFGTPMWAPLDQILPGRAIPDPTWDTYALCVVLYASLTGSRPAYQSEPSALLTPRGKSLWNTAAEAIRGRGLDSQTKREAFIASRAGTTASDLIDLTGHSALIATDKAILEEKIGHLSKLASVPEDKIRLLQRGIWDLLCRGLSPASHPSPPNRYRDGAELAEQIEDLRDLLGHEAPHAAKSAPAPDTMVIDNSVPDRSISKGPGLGCWLAIILLSGLTLALGLSIVLWPWGATPWEALKTRVAVPPQRIWVHKPVVSPTLDMAKTWKGHEVLVEGKVFRFEGGNILSFHYEIEEGINEPSVTLSGGELNPPVTLILPNLAPGRNRVNVQIPNQIEFPPGRYKLSYQNRDIRPLVRGNVIKIKGRRVHFEDWSTNFKKVVATYEEVLVQPFRIDRCEVSQARWARCVEAKHCVGLQATSISKLPAIVPKPEWAEQFCKWRGGALPTVEQWKAATGPQLFPWGDELPQCHLANGLGCSGAVRPTCSTPEGASPDGAQDLAGNVREWAWVNPQANIARLMGGSYLSGPNDLGASSELFPPTHFLPEDAGFRCIYPPN